MDIEANVDPQQRVHRSEVNNSCTVREGACKEPHELHMSDEEGNISDEEYSNRCDVCDEEMPCDNCDDAETQSGIYKLKAVRVCHEKSVEVWELGRVAQKFGGSLHVRESILSKPEQRRRARAIAMAMAGYSSSSDEGDSDRDDEDELEADSTADKEHGLEVTCFLFGDYEDSSVFHQTVIKMPGVSKHLSKMMKPAEA